MENCGEDVQGAPLLRNMAEIVQARNTSQGLAKECGGREKHEAPVDYYILVFTSLYRVLFIGYYEC